MRGARSGLRKPTSNGKDSRANDGRKNGQPNNDKKITIKDNKDAKNNNDSVQYCDICAQLVPGPEREKIFAFGRCDHIVCYVCSTRLRVICDQTDCPICRDKLEKVIFSGRKDKLYSEFDLSSCLYDEKFKIYFESEAIKKAYDKLLKFECLECVKNSKKTDSKETNKTKKTLLATNSMNGRESRVKSPTDKQSKRDTGEQGFEEPSKDVCEKNLKNGSSSEQKDNNLVSNNGTITEDSSGLLNNGDVPKGAQFLDVLTLKNHLNYVHKLRLCDLCLTHNKLFPHEYSYYDPIELRKHMKEGEPNTSHRGHPDCKLCHDTFFNMEELLLHMSREHFHCHICARQDTNLRYYFMDYTSLREHFRNKHFLCERGNCRFEQFTSAFENEIEYQLHVFNVHGNPSSSRGESRHQRTITLDSAPHRSTNRGSSPTSSRQVRQDPNVAIVTTGQMATANNSVTQRPPENILNQLRQQRMPSRNEFPALGQDNLTPTSSYTVVPIGTTGPQSSSSSVGQPIPIRNRRINAERPSSSIQPTSDNFPSIPTSSSQPKSFVRTLGGGIKRPEQLNQSDFPPLPEQPKPKSSSSKNNKNQQKSARVAIKDMTLDQLIRNSLVVGPSTSRSDNNGSKRNNSKNVKHKPLKIQLS